MFVDLSRNFKIHLCKIMIILDVEKAFRAENGGGGEINGAEYLVWLYLEIQQLREPFAKQILAVVCGERELPAAS